MTEPTNTQLIIENIEWDDDGSDTGLPTTVTVDWWGDHPNEAPEGFVNEVITKHLTTTYYWLVVDYSWRVA